MNYQFSSKSNTPCYVSHHSSDLGPILLQLDRWEEERLFLQDVDLVPRLRFSVKEGSSFLPSRCFVPGDIRNDLYLTLERGEFERGGKSVQKNIEVTVYVLYADGDTLKVRNGAQRDDKLRV